MNRNVVEELDQTHRLVSSGQRRMLELIVVADREQRWRDDGARDCAHWVSMRYGISWWKAQRWLRAAYALQALPHLAEALGSGEVSLDKAVEIARFATPDTESELISWSRGVSVGAVRRRADLALRPSIQDDRDAHEARFLSWWFLDEGRRMGLEAQLPAAQGAIVVKAIERVPVMPGEQEPVFVPARRADALVAICSGRIAADPDPDRATVIVHTRLDGETAHASGSEIERGPVIHPETLRRLRCNARTQTVLEDRAGNPIGLGRTTREPSAWLLRQIRYRDRECRFPGCGARRFAEAHHIRWWRDGGRTDPENLLLVCSFHHRLVHELGWRVKRRSDGEVWWFRPDGVRYRAGPELVAAR